MQYREWLNLQILRLRAVASERKREGANTAAAYELIANDLAEAHAEFLAQELTLREAVAYSGYSASTIKLMKAKGTPLTRAHLPVRPRGPRPRAVARSASPAETTASRRIRRKAS